MAKVTRSSFQGLILHDDRFSLSNLSDTYSSYNEGQPIPSEPTPTVKGWLDVEATGTAAAGDSYDLDTLNSGRAVGGEGGGTFRWRATGDTADRWRGFLAHNKVIGSQWVLKTTHNYAAAVPLPNGRAAMVCLFPSGPHIIAGLRTTAGVWSTSTVTTDAASTGRPSIVRLPDNAAADGGRLICVFVRGDLVEGGNTYITLSTYYSDNDGSTWAEVVKHSPTWRVSATNRDIKGITAVWSNGYITLVVACEDTSTSPDTSELYHLVSTDNGASWIEVESIQSNSTWRRNPHLWADAGGAVGMVYHREAGASTDARYARKSAPLATFAGAASYDSEFIPDIPVDANASPLRPIGAAVDAEGFLWVFARQSSLNQVEAYRFDAATLAAAKGGDLLYPTGAGVITRRHPIDTGDTAGHLLDMALVPCGSSLILLTNTNVQGGILEVALGGYSSRDWAVQSFGYRGNTPTPDRVGICYLPIDLPSVGTSLWTASGAGTEAISSNGLDLTTAANVISYTRDGPSSPAGNPCLVSFTVNVTSGGSLSSNDVAVLLRRADNSVHYEAILRLTTTSARLYDANAAAAVGSDVTSLSTGARDWLFVIEGNRVAVWYRPPFTGVWTAGPSGTLADGGGGTTPNRVTWGHLSSAAAGSSWRWFGSAIDNEPADPGLTTQTAADLYGRAWSSRPLWLDGGWLLSARGGPSYRGDAWTAASGSRYPIANVHMEVAPSPAVQWRSADTTEQVIAWELSGTDPTYLLSSSFGVALLRPNFRTAYFEARTGAGVWTTLITFDSATPYEGSGGALSYTISGDHVYPATGTNAGGKAFAMEELRGGYAILESGGADVAVKILHNSAGVWRPGTENRAVDIRVAPIPTITGETSIRFIPPTVIGIRHEVTNQHYVAFRLRIPASQATVNGFYRLGGIVAGPLALFAPEAGNGRVYRTVGNVRTTTDSAGRQRVRQMGDPRRELEFSWVDPIWTGELYQQNTDPDYLVARDAAAYHGIGIVNDARILEGALRRADAGAIPVAYVERIDPAGPASDQSVYVDPANFLVGRLFGPVTRQNVTGDNVGRLEDRTGGLYAINRVTITEIV